MSNLKNRKALVVVTGASRGFGRAVAAEMAKVLGQNSKFILTARSQPDLDATAKLVQDTNPQVEAASLALDGLKPTVADFEALMSLAKLPQVKYDIAVIVHNAGSLGKQGRYVKDLNDIMELQEYFTLNLFSASVLNSVFVEKTKDIGARFVVNVTSLAAQVPFSSWSLYCTGKAARDMFFQTLAKEEPGLRVLNYAPGPLDTAMISEIMDDSGTDANIKTMFEELFREKKMLKPETSALKLVDLLQQNKFESGSHIDYFDAMP